NPAADDRQIIVPPPPELAATITTSRGPNIQPPPVQTALSETLIGRVLIVVGDDISTGDLSPDGAEVMAFRSNISAMANYVFRRLHRNFANRARGGGGDSLVGAATTGRARHASMRRWRRSSWACGRWSPRALPAFTGAT